MFVTFFDAAIFSDVFLNNIWRCLSPFLNQRTENLHGKDPGSMRLDETDGTDSTRRLGASALAAREVFVVQTRLVRLVLLLPND
jgi:hypothetical protein